MRRDAPPYVFYEGPPTANGLPGLHHVLARSYKDVFARYKQMTGFSVARKAGWDTHGLPVELEVERALKISGKKQIEAFGIAEFNARCKESVNEYIDQWREMSERLGVLARLRPSVPDVRQHVHRVGLVEPQGALGGRPALPGLQGHAVLPALPDHAVVARAESGIPRGHAGSFRLRQVPPQRLRRQDVPARVDHDAVDASRATSRSRCTRASGTCASRRATSCTSSPSSASTILDGDYEILDEMDGRDLVDLTYEPLFTDMLPEGLAFVVLDAPELVSMDEGTGIVHTAAAYGVADLELCQRKGVAVRHVVGSRRPLPRRPDALSRACSSRTPTRRSSRTCASMGKPVPRRADPAHVSVLLALRHAAALLRDHVVVHPHHCGQGSTARAQPQRALAAGAHPRRADGQLAREPDRLEPVAKPVLGHAAARSGSASRATRSSARAAPPMSA